MTTPALQWLVVKMCAWWNLVCQGGEQVADSGLSAITKSTANGLVQLFSGITKVVDESTQVPLTDPTYRDVYAGFVGLAIPIITAVYFIALLAAVLRRDPTVLVRATLGVAVSAIGGAVYILFAQLLVAMDNWLSRGIVSVTSADFGEQMDELAEGFSQMGAQGDIAANMLMLLLMFAALIAGVILWVILLLRKMAILVVVVFAPLLIAGWLWGPTRAWSRKATETLVALVFCKSVIFAIFGVGMRLLFRGFDQSLSDFVGVVVLLCGACFAPLVMLRLVHFAADTQLAGEMMASLKTGARPITSHVPVGSLVHAGGGRSDMARDYARGGSTQPAGGATVGGPQGYGPSAGSSTGAGGKSGAVKGASGATTAGAKPPVPSGAAGGGASSAGGGAVAGGAAAGVAAVGVVAAQAAVKGSKKAAASASSAQGDFNDAVAPGPDVGGTGSNHDKGN
ncbi:type IV secretion system protein [Mumia qirimensis]|uniref:type IV secretion system protein n=1 Tax=Mumia qirimensis TaxID=3234852 RepID=UPI00351CCA0A